MLPRRHLDPNVVLAHLDPGLAGADLAEVGEGWDNVAWSVQTGAEPLILRIGKTADPDERAAVTVTDAALLDFVIAHSSLATNQVLAADPMAGALLLTQVPGVAAQTVEIADPEAVGHVLGRFLRRLHRAVPPAGLVESGTQAARRLAEARVAFAAIADRFGMADRSPIGEFLAGPPPAEPTRLVFCHNDLGGEHVLIDPVSGLPSGVIDWSDARLTDPAVDFALLWFDLGADVVTAALEAYGAVADDFVERIRWYAVHAGVAGVAFRMATADPQRDAVLARLRALLAESLPQP